MGYEVTEDREDAPVKGGQRANFLVRFMAYRPCLVMLLALLFALVLSALGMVIGEFEVSADNDGWNSRNTPVANKAAQDSARLNLWAALRGEEQDYRRRSLQLFPTPLDLGSALGSGSGASAISEPAFNIDDDFHGHDLLALYRMKKKGENAVTRQSLMEICEYEVKVFSIQVREDVCRRHDWDHNGNNELVGQCYQPLSFVTLIREYVFLTKYPNGENRKFVPCDKLFSEVTDEDIEAIADLYAYEAKYGSNQIPDYYFNGLTGKDMVNDGANETMLLRTIFPMREGSVDRAYDLHTSGKLEATGKEVWSLAYDVGDAELTDMLIDDVLQEDMIMAVAATAIILFLIWFHTRSVFMAFVGVIQVALSFPSAYFAYKLLLGFKFFPFLNFLAMFVVSDLEREREGARPPPPPFLHSGPLTMLTYPLALPLFNCLSLCL